MPKTIYAFLFIFILFVNVSLSQIQYESSTDTIVVTANKSGSNLSDLSRSVAIVSKEMLFLFPSRDFIDNIGLVAGSDLRTRGSAGIQQDLQIRGGSFEQALPLVNGVKVSDPQTGHHNLNIPINFHDIEKIEILRGHGSRVFGPNAFTGAANFIVRPRKYSSIIVGSNGGSYGSFDNYAYLSYPFKNYSNSISYSLSKSDGYIKNTSFEKYNIGYNGEFTSENANVKIYLGKNYKSFGANGFYSASFPNQRENIETHLLTISADIGGETFSLLPKLSYRKAQDEFMLNYENPYFYRNLHKTDAFNSELGFEKKFDKARIYLGGEYSFDKINSNNLGKRYREKFGFSVETSLKYENLNISAGAFAHKYSNIKWTISPGADASYLITNNFKVFGSIGRSFRLPTFTELFYSDPVNQGSPNLLPEKAWSGELGIEAKNDFSRFVLSGFLRNGFNIIDWTRNSTAEKWKATNISNVDAKGFEIEVSSDLYRLVSIPIAANIGYAFCELGKQTPTVFSKYSLENLKHQFIANLNAKIFQNATITLVGRYEKRVKVDEYFLTDLKASYKIWNFKLYASALNLFDVKYRDFASVPQPGRWLTVGIEFNYNDF